MRYLLTILLSIFCVGIADVSAQEAGDGKAQFDSTFRDAARYYYSGNYDSAYICTQRMVKEAIETGDKRYLASAYTLSAVYNNRRDNVREKLENLLRAVDIYKEIRDSVRMSATYRYIGEIFGELKMYESAYDIFYRAINIAVDCNNEYEESRGYSSLFSYTMHDLDGKSDTVAIVRQIENIIAKMQYYSRLFINDTIDRIHRLNIVRLQSNLVSANILLAKYTENQSYIDSAQMYCDMIKMSSEYYGITKLRSSVLETSVLLAQNRNSEALARYKEIEEQSKTQPLPNSNFARLYDNMGTACARLGMTRDAIGYKRRSLVYQNELANEYNIAIGFDYQTQLLADNEVSSYERGKERDDYYRAEQLNTARAITYCILGVLLVLIAVLTISGLSLQKNRKVTKQLNSLYKKHEEHNRKLTEQREEIENQNQIIEKQRDTVEKINDEIMSSLSYAQRIQKAAYSQDNDIMNVFEHSFRMILSTSVVTGCFHNTQVLGNFKLLAAATCSKTGVPGSFFAMLGLSALKECMIQYRPEQGYSPSEVLNTTNRNLKRLIGKMSGDAISETIDISVIALDSKSHRLYFSGANQNMFVCQNSEIDELRGNRYSLCHPDSSTFATVEYQATPGAMVYIVNNSVVRQVGSVSNEMFGNDRIQDMLLSVYTLPPSDQKAQIEKTITQWFAGNNQIGDIAIIGVRC